MVQSTHISFLTSFPCQVDHHNDRMSLPVLVPSHFSRAIPRGIVLVVPVGVLRALTSYADEWTLLTLVPRLIGPQIATKYCVNARANKIFCQERTAISQTTRRKLDERNRGRTIVRATNFDSRFLDFVCDGEAYILTNCGLYYNIAATNLLFNIP